MAVSYVTVNDDYSYTDRYFRCVANNSVGYSVVCTIPVTGMFVILTICLFVFLNSFYAHHKLLHQFMLTMKLCQSVSFLILFLNMKFEQTEEWTS